MTKKLLALASEFETEEKRFQEYFESIDVKSLADVMIDSKVGEESEVYVDGEEIENWDSVYIKPEPKAFNYNRVLAEIINQKEVICNLDPSSIFILTKKPFLLNVLSEKGINTPSQVSISTEKGLTEIEKDIDFPVLAKKYSNLITTESKIFDDFEELKSFSELSEHGKDFITIQEYDENSLFDVIYIDGKIISLKVDGNPWSSEEEEKISKSYHTISDEMKEVIREAAESIGTKICYVRISGDHIIDMDTDLKLEMFKQESGKNVYGRVAEVLKGEKK